MTSRVLSLLLVTASLRTRTGDSSLVQAVQPAELLVPMIASTLRAIYFGGLRQVLIALRAARSRQELELTVLNQALRQSMNRSVPLCVVGFTYTCTSESNHDSWFQTMTHGP